MKKRKTFSRVRFSARTLNEAENALQFIFDEKQRSANHSSLQVVLKDATWEFNTFDEFLAAADEGDVDLGRWAADRPNRGFWVHKLFSGALVAVEAPTRDEVERIFRVFEEHAPTCRIPDDDTESGDTQPVIFIGHGHDTQWRDLKDHLHEQHGYEVEAYEVGARAGHTVRDILEEMLERSSFALLVMTAEDELKGGGMRARQNVVHEAGLFQGKLGFSRAVVLLEQDTEDFSNISGVHQLRFSKGRIKEVFGDVLAVLRREFGGPPRR